MIRNSALSIYQLLGAPLKAMIDAETQAALATAEFIERIGFDRSGDETPRDDPAHFGKLRMVTFLHEKKGANGDIRQFKIEVPLLSLIPIPALQIKDAEIDFSILIIDEVKVNENTTSNTNPGETSSEQGIPPPFTLKNLGGEGIREMKGTFGSSSSENSKRNSLEAQMRVKMRLEQADIPAGLGKLFHIMEQNVSVSEDTIKALPEKTK